MTSQIALTLTIIGLAVLLFASEKLRVDVIALLVLLSLALTGLVSPLEAFAGFANPAVVTVWAVFIVSAGLLKTGVADYLGARILHLAGKSEARLIAVIMLTCGLMSSIMNNIGATAVLLPALIGISRQSKVPPSKLLIPLSFASLMGGNMTLIGTPPNIIASSILAERGLPSFEFFDFAPMGGLIFAVGILYMLLIGRRLLPVRKTAEEQQIVKLREYVSEVRLAPNSPLVGKNLVESGLGSDYDLTVMALTRDEVPVPLHEHTYFQPGDLLTVECSVENLMQAREDLRLIIEAQRKLGLEQEDPRDIFVIEATLSPRSRMRGRTLREMRFRDLYGYTALAIWRHGEVITQRLRDVRLRFGDALLLQGPRHRLSALQEGEDFLVLEPRQVENRQRKKAPVVAIIIILILGLVTLGNFHISVAMVIGAVAMVLTGCLTMDEAYQSIEWRSVFLIAGMLPLGMAMETTGTARYLADQIVGWLGGLGPLAILMGIYVLASLITEPMSNAAATVLMVPIAIDVALGLGADPRSFVLATVIGASTSFLTPVGHQANVLVFGPGGYRFIDYTRVGGPLNIALLIATLIFLPLLWPLF